MLIAFRPDPDDLLAWAEAGVSELIWGVPDKSEDEVLAYLDKLAGRLGITPAESRSTGMTSSARVAVTAAVRRAASDLGDGHLGLAVGTGHHLERRREGLAR